MKSEIPSVVTRLTKTVCLTLIAESLICAVIAALVLKEVVPDKVATNAASISNILLIGLVSYWTARHAPRQKLAVAAISALLIIGVQLILKSLLFSSAYLSADWRLMSAAAVCIPAGIIASQRKQRRR